MRGTRTEEMFLVSHVLAMGEQPSADDEVPSMSWDYCTHLRRCSILYSDPKARGFGGPENPCPLRDWGRSIPLSSTKVHTFHQWHTRFQWWQFPSRCSIRFNTILNKLGVSKSFPHRVAFGPKDLCGMALMDMNVEQGICRVKHFTNHLFSRDSVGNLILIALWSLQLESGCGFHLLKCCPSVWVPYITKCWLTSIRDFISRNKIKIKVASACLVQTSIKHNCHVMDAIQMLELYNDQPLFDINAVRMHLKVMTLSDIVDATCQRITEEAYKGQKLSDRYSRLKWPRQPVITMKQRNLWKAALEAAFTSSGMVLKQPLGKWTGPPTQVWRSFLQSRNKKNCHFDDWWWYDLIYGIYGASMNLPSGGCYSICYCIHVCVSRWNRLEHYDYCQSEEHPDWTCYCNFSFAHGVKSRQNWWCWLPGNYISRLYKTILRDCWCMSSLSLAVKLCRNIVWKITRPWRLELMGLSTFKRKQHPLDGCWLGTRLFWLLMAFLWFLAQQEQSCLELQHQTCCYFISWSSIRLSLQASVNTNIHTNADTATMWILWQWSSKWWRIQLYSIASNGWKHTKMIRNCTTTLTSGVE